MNSPQMRKLLINLHLIFAGIMAPAFLLLAISGGLYLIGIKGTTQDTLLTLPADAALDFSSDTIDDDVRSLLSRAEIDHEFEYVSDKGSFIQLRPMSRTYVTISREDDGGLSATRHVPDFQKSMIELHKGHGPLLFKLYHKFVAILLIGVVLGGLAVGLMSRAYRGKTLFSLGIGTLLFFILALFS